jgi:hypothetical protein
MRVHSLRLPQLWTGILNHMYDLAWRSDIPFISILSLDQSLDQRLDQQLISFRNVSKSGKFAHPANSQNMHYDDDDDD